MGRGGGGAIHLFIIEIVTVLFLLVIGTQVTDYESSSSDLVAFRNYY